MFESRLTVAVGLLTLTAAALAALRSDDPAPALALVGALVLAIIAAETADTRQRRQIDADTERQERALEAERERHLALLAHDRELADLDDLRELLDEAAVALHRGDQAIGGVRLAHTEHGPSMHEHKPEAGAELNEVGQELDALGARLSVRLGRQEHAVQTFRTATDAALEVSGEIFWLEDDRAEETRAKRATIDTARDTYTDAASRFIVAAVELAGVQRPDTASATDEGTTAPETNVTVSAAPARMAG